MKTKAENARRAYWPADLQELYGISATTVWRWERLGKLPPRDVNIGGKSGWRPETLAAAETGATGARAT